MQICIIPILVHVQLNQEGNLCLFQSNKNYSNYFPCSVYQFYHGPASNFLFFLLIMMTFFPTSLQALLFLLANRYYEFDVRSYIFQCSYKYFLSFIMRHCKIIWKIMVLLFQSRSEKFTAKPYLIQSLFLYQLAEQPCSFFLFSLLAWLISLVPSQLASAWLNSQVDLPQPSLHRVLCL